MDIILSFSTTRHAICGEQLLLAAGELVHVMPKPGKIAAGCGICLRLPVERRESADAILQQGGCSPEGTYIVIEHKYKTLPPPLFTKALGIRTGDIVAIIGCGGKTSLANRLAMENRFLPVLFSTMTRIRPPSGAVVDRCLDSVQNGELLPGVTLACKADGEKLCGISGESIQYLHPANGLTFLEADGSRGLPLKGWAGHEPVIPSFATLTIGVCTVGLIGEVYSDAMAHRPELFRQAVGIHEGDCIGIEHMVAMVNEMFHKAAGRKILYINQVESPEEERAAQLLAKHFDNMGIATGSLHGGSVCHG